MSTAALLLDYLFAGELIKARLASQVSELASADAVDGVEQLAQAVARNINAPRAFVMYEGDVFNTSDAGRAGGGASQIVQQQWSVILAVRNAAQHEGDARNASAGPLLSRVHKALAGWAPPGAVRPFVRVQGRRPNYSANVGLYPLTFGLSLNL